MFLGVQSMANTSLLILDSFAFTIESLKYSEAAKNYYQRLGKFLLIINIKSNLIIFREKRNGTEKCRSTTDWQFSKKVFNCTAMPAGGAAPVSVDAKRV